ncbi:hypothetical protein J2S22_006091 [Rhodoplanes tepidamans]|nr:hypothetical protein [Rhodoplanes tepidamans]
MGLFQRHHLWTRSAFGQFPVLRLIGLRDYGDSALNPLGSEAEGAHRIRSRFGFSFAELRRRGVQ